MNITESIQTANGVEVARSCHQVIQRNPRVIRLDPWKKLLLIHYVQLNSSEVVEAVHSYHSADSLEIFLSIFKVQS